MRTDHILAGVAVAVLGWPAGAALGQAMEAPPVLGHPGVIPLRPPRQGSARDAPAAGAFGPSVVPPVVPPAPGGGCNPAGLIRMTTRNVSPGLQASAAAAQPRTLYRQGNQFLRVDQSLDLTNGRQSSVIVAEPDIWEVERVTRTGRHSTDPGPVLEASAPVITAPQAPAKFRTLEFGCEMDFLKANAAVPIRRLNPGPNEIDIYAVTEGEHTVAMMIGAQRRQPLMVSYARGGTPVLVIRYDSYGVSEADSPQLFRPPPGFRIEETSGLLTPPTARP